MGLYGRIRRIVILSSYPAKASIGSVLTAIRWWMCILTFQRNHLM